MEFEEMKSLWGEMSEKIELQKKLTDSLIIRMTKSEYKNIIVKIFIPELIGAIICFIAVLYILLSIQKLDRWYLMAFGITTILILILLPILSFLAIHKIRSVNIPDNNYKQSLLKYSKGKQQFVFIQKLSVCLGAVLLLTVLPVMGQLIAGKDLFIESRLWLWYIVGYPFFYGFSKWVFRKYAKTTAEAESILKELENG
jgi:hypothetical protein